MFPEGEIVQTGARIIITALPVGVIGGVATWLADRWGMFSTQAELNQQKELQEKQKAARTNIL